MKSAEMNLSTNTRKARQEKKIVFTLGLFAVILLACMYLVQIKLDKALAQKEKIESSIARTNAERPAPVEKKLNAFWQESRINWPGLFSVLEGVKSTDITLLAVDPNPDDKKLSILGLAKDQEALNLYLSKLESSDSLQQVELQRYRRTTQSPNGLEFFVLSDWDGDE